MSCCCSTGRMDQNYSTRSEVQCEVAHTAFCPSSTPPRKHRHDLDYYARYRNDDIPLTPCPLPLQVMHQSLLPCPLVDSTASVQVIRSSGRGTHPARANTIQPSRRICRSFLTVQTWLPKDVASTFSTEIIGAWWTRLIGIRSTRWRVA